MKLPEICPAPPMIGSRITGAEITSLSSTIAKGRPTFSLRGLAELARARGIEAEIDDRLAGALVETGLRVGEVAARDDDALLDQVGHAAFACACRRGFPIPAAGGVCQRLLGGHGLVDHAEIELGGLAAGVP